MLSFAAQHTSETFISDWLVLGIMLGIFSIYIFIRVVNPRRKKGRH